MIAEEERLLKLIERQEDMLGNAVKGKAVTATLRVSPDGSGADGLSWRTAFQTIGEAHTAASADANDLTVLLLAPGTYDIDTTGDPNFTKNIVLQGSQRDWVHIVNEHASADSVIGFTGYAALFDLTINCGEGSLNGIAFGGGGSDGARIERVYIEAENVTGAHNGITVVGGTEYLRFRDLLIHGVKAHTTGIFLNNCTLSHFYEIDIVQCLTGLNLSNTSSDLNHFHDWHFENCTLGMDINGGNNQEFARMHFSGCTRNVDDEVGDHDWVDIEGRFDIEILPDDLTGIAVTCGGANTYGSDTELLSAASRDNPFRVVGVTFAPSASPAEWYMVRFTDDAGSTFYDILMFKGDKREGIAAPKGTEHIFNRGTRISCSAKSESGSNTVNIWVEPQEI